MDVEMEFQKALLKLDADVLSKEIVAREWAMFQRVQNVGGPAPCQNKPQEFAIMRLSQAMSWPQEARESYMEDLMAAEATGRNLLTEKYAIMMKSTFPQEYAEIKFALPTVSEEAAAIVEELTALVVEWAEQFQKQYPCVAATGRPIHTAEDSCGISVETYNRGEFSTYSLRTLKLLREYYIDCKAAGRSIHIQVVERTARFYGYADLHAAEASLA